MQKYNGWRLSKLLNMNVRTIYSRFRSRYAYKRWGVETITRPDGTIQRYLPEDKLYLWRNSPSYVGRPPRVEEGASHE